MNVEFMITDPNSGQNYFPAVQEGITWTFLWLCLYTERE